MYKATILKNSPKRSFKEIIEICWRVLKNNYIEPRLKVPKRDKTTDLEIQKLHLQAQKILGELEILEADLGSIKYIKGTITQKRKPSEKDPNVVYISHVLRWWENGNRKEKHLAKTKKKDSDLTLEEATELINNSERAQELKRQIHERKKAIELIQDKISDLSNELIEITDRVKQINNSLLIGRQDELQKMQENLLLKISTLIIGEPGIGKTTLLKTLIENNDQIKIIWIESLKAPKATLGENIIFQLHEDNVLKIESIEMMGSSEEDIKKALKGKSISQLTEIIRDSIKGKNYLIAFDSLAGISQANKIVLEKLFESKVPIFAATNQIKASIEFESLYRKFAKLELKPLTNQAMQNIINGYLEGLKFNEWIELLKSRILTASSGNPGIAMRMINDAYALSLGGELTENQIRSLEAPELSRRYFSLSPFMMMGIAGFAVLRFIGMGTNDTLLYILGGCSFVILMAFSRNFMKGWG